MKRTIIDSHIHVWKLDRGDYFWLTPDEPILYRDYEIEYLKPLLNQYKVDGVIVVQAAPTLEETRYLLQLAKQHPEIIGVVGWVDVEAEDADSSIDWLNSQSKLVGIRLDSGFLSKCKSDPKRGMLQRVCDLNQRGLAVDWLVPARDLDALCECMKVEPEIVSVINHLGSPELSDDGYKHWYNYMAHLAAYPHVVVKLSGMLTQGNASIADRHADYVTALCNLFGPKRLMFGSDWPVLRKGGTYGSAIAYLEKLLPSSLGEEELDAIFSGNAHRVYSRIVRK
jgi:L-fuconolactonase